MTTRAASHAGSWYTSNGVKLDEQLTSWLSAVQGERFPLSEDVAREDASTRRGDPTFLPIPGIRAIIAPHAGYSYSGPPAAYAYKCIDPSRIKRVFVLGPSHHFYLNGCALSKCKTYETPLGGLPLDRKTMDELKAKGEQQGRSTRFDWMDLDQDEDEHSIEMHLPYVRKVFEGMDIEIVPILVGSIDGAKEAAYGKLLAPYLADPENFFVVSSDFCHWGSRFSYTYYRSTEPDSKALKLSSSTRPDPACPIHRSIRQLDNGGIQAISFNTQHQPPRSAQEAQRDFAAYLQKTKNTICGRHPIGVLLGALAELEAAEGVKAECRFTRYEQSSACTSLSDSSVSYASAFIRFP